MRTFLKDPKVMESVAPPWDRGCGGGRKTGVLRVGSKKSTFFLKILDFDLPFEKIKSRHFSYKFKRTSEFYQQIKNCICIILSVFFSLFDYLLSSFGSVE